MCLVRGEGGAFIVARKIPNRDDYLVAKTLNPRAFIPNAQAVDLDLKEYNRISFADKNQVNIERGLQVPILRQLYETTENLPSAIYQTEIRTHKNKSRAYLGEQMGVNPSEVAKGATETLKENLAPTLFQFGEVPRRIIDTARKAQATTSQEVLHICLLYTSDAADE